LGLFRKEWRRWFPSALAVSKSDARSASVVVDELDAGRPTCVGAVGAVDASSHYRTRAVAFSSPVIACYCLLLPVIACIYGLFQGQICALFWIY